MLTDLTKKMIDIILGRPGPRHPFQPHPVESNLLLDCFTHPSLMPTDATDVF
jgi:hypothetical protein